jgi:hypothetical protein
MLVLKSKHTIIGAHTTFNIHVTNPTIGTISVIRAGCPWPLKDFIKNEDTALAELKLDSSAQITNNKITNKTAFCVDCELTWLISVSDKIIESVQNIR